jgi:cell division protein FtsL
MIRSVIYAPHLLVLFLVFFFETSTQLGVFEDDYAQRTLRQQIREVDQRIYALELKKNELERLDRIHDKAPDLDLVAPEPGQIEVIHASFVPEPNDTRASTDLARVIADMDRFSQSVRQEP